LGGGTNIGNFSSFATAHQNQNITISPNYIFVQTDDGSVHSITYNSLFRRNYTINAEEHAKVIVHLLPLDPSSTSLSI